jgi:hypothetical protein
MGLPSWKNYLKAKQILHICMTLNLKNIFTTKDSIQTKFQYLKKTYEGV